MERAHQDLEGRVAEQLHQALSLLLGVREVLVDQAVEDRPPGARPRACRPAASYMTIRLKYSVTPNSSEVEPVLDADRRGECRRPTRRASSACRRSRRSAAGSSARCARYCAEPFVALDEELRRCSAIQNAFVATTSRWECGPSLRDPHLHRHRPGAEAYGRRQSRANRPSTSASPERRGGGERRAQRSRFAVARTRRRESGVRSRRGDSIRAQRAAEQAVGRGAGAASPTARGYVALPRASSVPARLPRRSSDEARFSRSSWIWNASPSARARESQPPSPRGGAGHDRPDLERRG